MSASINDAIISGVMAPQHLELLQEGISWLRAESVLRQELQNQLNWGLESFRAPDRVPYSLRTPVDRLVPGFDRLLISVTRRTGFFETQRPQYLRSIYQLAAIVDEPAPERFQQLRQLVVESAQGQGLLYGLPWALTADAVLAFRQDAEIRAQIAYVSTGLAIERYRLEHGSLPDTLEVLAPDYMAEIPRDPFSDGPLRYRRHDNGFTLSSTGLNGVNMGQGKNDSESDWNWDATIDLPFKVQYRPNTPGVSAELEGQPDTVGESEG